MVSSNNKVNAKSPGEISQDDADALHCRCHCDGINGGKNDCDGAVKTWDCDPAANGNPAFDVVNHLGLEVYPEPSQGRLNIRFAAIDAPKRRVAIYDLYGKQALDTGNRTLSECIGQ